MVATCGRRWSKKAPWGAYSPEVLPARSWREFTLLLTLGNGYQGNRLIESTISITNSWVAIGKQTAGDHSPFGEVWKTSKLLTNFIASDPKIARSEGRFSKRYSFFGYWRKTLCAQTNPARSGRDSKQSLFWHPHLQPTQTLRKNEVSFIEWAIPALFCVQGGGPTTRNRMDYYIWITFNNNMNDLNDGKDRLILMGTLFIVLFLFLL